MDTYVELDCPRADDWSWRSHLPPSSSVMHLLRKLKKQRVLKGGGMGELFGSDLIIQRDETMNVYSYRFGQNY